MHPSIRRCFNCNNKTHQKFWRDDRECPVCHEVSGYTESMHGGLSESRIAELRAIYLKLKRDEDKIVAETIIHNERGL